MDWNNPRVLWPVAGTTQSPTADYVPCLEPFAMSVLNAPVNTTAVRVDVWESSGNAFASIRRDVLRSTYQLSPQTSGKWSVTITQPLLFRRFYYITIYLTRSGTNSTTQTASPTQTIATTTSGNLTITTTTTNTPAAPPQPANANNAAPGNPTITTKIDTLESKEVPKVYAIPLRSEISSLQFLGAIGDAGFTTKDIHSFGHNIGFITGLKLKLRPISTNPVIGRFGLYPRASRWSLIIGTLVNDVNYKSTPIEASLFGLKPVVGGDFEFGQNGNFGISAGAIFGKQNTLSKLNDSKNVVVGFFIGFSFSADVFKALRNNVPANQNFPNLNGQ